jgi:hypothetical protein
VEETNKKERFFLSFPLELESDVFVPEVISWLSVLSWLSIALSWLLSADRECLWFVSILGWLAVVLNRLTITVRLTISLNRLLLILLNWLSILDWLSILLGIVSLIAVVLILLSWLSILSLLLSIALILLRILRLCRNVCNDVGIIRSYALNGFCLSVISVQYNAHKNKNACTVKIQTFLLKTK